MITTGRLSIKFELNHDKICAAAIWIRRFCIAASFSGVPGLYSAGTLALGLRAL